MKVGCRWKAPNVSSSNKELGEWERGNGYDKCHKECKVENTEICLSNRQLDEVGEMKLREQHSHVGPIVESLRVVL